MKTARSEVWSLHSPCPKVIRNFDCANAPLNMTERKRSAKLISCQKGLDVASIKKLGWIGHT